MNFDSFIRRYVNTCRFVKLVCFCFEKYLKKYIYVCIIEICFLKLLHGEIVIFRPLTNIYYSCSSPLLSSDLLCLIDQTWLRCVKLVCFLLCKQPFMTLNLLICYYSNQTYTS